MKITTNSIGNYSINNHNTFNTNNIKKAEVTPEEKKFFANMYPEKQKEIMTYEFYNSKGKVIGVTIGSIIDRRG